MNIEEITITLINHPKRQGSEWDELKHKLEVEVNTSNEASFLKKCIEIDLDDILPFDQKNKIFEKLISLERTHENLKKYAWWLQLNGGPEFDSLASSLLAEVLK